MSSDPTLATTAPAAGGGERAGMPATTGRYRVLRRLGAGGMGVVYAGHDPQLDRPVAIKVLHERGGHRAHLAERLHREARALAKVTHPNVVSVYDVGVEGGEVYVVMQYVDGQTLDHVLAARAHTRDEVLALFAAAGRGLSAAHATDLVHRDFKPTNVLVDGDGTVRVSDFGLARVSDLAESESLASDDLAASLTRGDLVGTPAYMAPEQFRRGPITAATDQFSFCVALWEALCEERPFAGDSIDTIREAVLAGDVRVPPAARRLPARLEKILRRGLATDPTARFPSIEALLEALAPRRTRAFAVTGGIATLAAAGAFAVWPTSASDPCRGADRAIAQVWAPATRDRLHAALAAVAHPSATQIADETVARLDERAARWRGARIETCTAHRVRRTEPTDVYDRRVGCLDESLDTLREIVDFLATKPDVLTLVRALDVSRRGTDPSACTAADTAGMLAPSGAHLPARDELEGKCQRAVLDDDALTKLGACTPFATMTAAIGDHARSADGWLRVMYALSDLEQSTWARQAAEHAAEQATAAGADNLAVEAWSEAALLAAENGELDKVEGLLSGARGAAARSHSQLSQIHLDTTVGFIALQERRHRDALAMCERAAATAEAMDGPKSRWIFEPLGCVVEAQENLGEMAAALATSRRQLAIAEAAWGADHPMTISGLERVAASLDNLQKTGEAGALWDRALTAYERIYGPDSIVVMSSLVRRANKETLGGYASTETARAAITRAVRIGEQRLGRTDPQLAHVYGTQALVLYPLGDRDGAAAAYRNAIAILEHGSDAAELAETLYNYADLLKETDHCGDAIPVFEHGAVVADAGGLAMVAANNRYGQGSCLGRNGHHVEGEAILARSIDELDAEHVPIFAAQARWELGWQMWLRGAKAEGIAIVQHASDELAHVEDPTAGPLKAQIDDWIVHPQ